MHSNMKKRIRKISGKIIVWLLASLFLISGLIPLFAQFTSRWDKWSSPEDVLEAVARWANDDYLIQDNELDDIDGSQWPYPSNMRIANTLSSFWQQIAPYLQWVVYIWLVAAVVMIIIQAYRLVVWWESEQWDAKEKITNVLIWVLILGTFYLIIQVFVAVINTFFA